jgi:TolB-like protein/Tfp pilus assembly protein PilF
MLNRIIMVLMGLAILLLLLDRFLPDTGDEASPAAPAEPVAEEVTPAKPKSIAVLPFVNMSNDPDQEFFSDGISEELLNALAKIRDLRVAARTSSFAFKGKNQDITKIGEQLKVSTVLEGSVRKAGTRVRITAQLINVEDGYHLWSETYDRELIDIFAIQDEIASAIVSALKVHLSDAESDATSKVVDLEAYNAYLLARHNLRERTEVSLQLAQSLYQKAIDIDPSYAAAWAGKALATELSSDFHYGSMPVGTARQQAQAMIDIAFGLDPDLAQAHAIQGLLYLNNDNPRGALEHIDRAIADIPSEGVLYSWRADALRDLGRINEADRAMALGYQTDPLHGVLRHNWIIALAATGKSGQAREMSTPDDPLAYITEYFIARPEGRYADLFTAVSRGATLLDKSLTPEMTELRSVASFFFLKNIELAQADSTEALSIIYDAILDPAQGYARASDLPAARHSANTRYALVWSLLALEQYQQALDAMTDMNMLERPITGAMDGPTDRLDFAIAYSWALSRLGRNEEAASLAQRIIDHIDFAVANGQRPTYFKSLAAAQSEAGDADAAIVSLRQALQYYRLDWVDLIAPWFQPLRAREDFQEIERAVIDHMNSERAKLGWEPIEL